MGDNADIDLVSLSIALSASCCLQMCNLPCASTDAPPVRGVFVYDPELNDRLAFRSLSLEAFLPRCLPTTLQLWRVLLS